MQFKVPQNIDMEDKIVGPLTLIQFIYILTGGLIDYIMFQSFGQYIWLFLLFALPIAVIALALAFLKIQDQPLSHFILAGLDYLRQPKVRFWKRGNYIKPIIYEPHQKTQVAEAPVITKNVEQSNLERLSYILDTRPQEVAQDQNFGVITKSFEKLLSTGYLKVHPPKRQMEGKNGVLGQAQK